MKESPKRYVKPFLSDEENDEVNLWKNEKVNFTTKLEDEKLGKSLAPLPNVPLDYIDKNVTECKLPELIACYDDSGFHVVKDICVDEGLSHGKKIEIDEEHHDLSCDSVIVNGDKHDAMIADLGTQFSKHKKQLISTSLEDCYKNTLISVTKDDKLPSDCPSDELKLFVESNSVQSSEPCGPDTSMQTGETKLDSSSISLINQDQLLTTIKVKDPSNNDVDQKLSEVQSAGSEADISNELKMEENPNSVFDNVKPVTIIGPLELPIDTQTAPNHHDMAPDNIAAANQLQRGGGESSFSMADPVSGLITYSGPTASAGSISHRSDASNTSVRSFAFPILQNEWNSSPVRMAKVDQRRARKHRGWRQAFMCCGF